MDRERMFELAQQLAVAKSRQDVPAALKVLHEEMLLETPAFGSRVRGLAENEQALWNGLHARRFAVRPDAVELAQSWHGRNDWRGGGGCSPPGMGKS